MASHGIRDQVAIIGMGCTPFGEHWDKSTDDMLVDSSSAALASAGVTLDDVDAFWLGTMGSGLSGLTLSRPLKIDYKPVTHVENFCATGSEAFRNACYGVASGAYDVAMAIGVEKLKDSGYSGLVGSAPAHDGTMSARHRAGQLLPAGPGLRPQVRRRRSRDEGRPHADRVEEPQERGAQPAGPVPQGGPEGHHRLLAARRRSARHLRLLRCERRLGRRHHRAGRGRLSLLLQPAVREGAVVHGRPGRRSDRPELRLHDLPRGGERAEDAYQQAGITNPRAELAMAEVHDCFTPTELVLMEDLGFAERGMAWKEVLAGTFDLEGELPVNPDGGLKSFGHPIGASGLRMLFECWLQLRGEAPEARQIASVAAGKTKGLTHNLGGAPGACVSFVSVVGTELG